MALTLRVGTQYFLHGLSAQRFWGLVLLQATILGLIRQSTCGRYRVPASKGKSEFDYPEFAEFHLRFNPAHDFMRFLVWLDAATPAAFNQVFASFAREPIGVILASCAIEGYLHYAGYQVDPEWGAFLKQRITVRERIERIYLRLGKPIDFGSGVFQRVIVLFKMRDQLVHPKFQEIREERDSPPPTLFDHVSQDYPSAVSRRIAEDFRDTLLADAKLKDIYWTQGFEERIRPKPVKGETLKL